VSQWKTSRQILENEDPPGERIWAILIHVQYYKCVKLAKMLTY
jgi:hypothetical protein